MAVQSSSECDPRVPASLTRGGTSLQIQLVALSENVVKRAERRRRIGPRVGLRSGAAHAWPWRRPQELPSDLRSFQARSPEVRFTGAHLVRGVVQKAEAVLDDRVVAEVTAGATSSITPP
jgi:hypothetical protein